MSDDLFGRVWRLEVVRGGSAEVFEGFDLRATARWPEDGAATVDLEVFHAPPTLIGLARDPATRWRVLAGYEGAGGASEIGGGAVVPESVSYRRTDVDPVLSLQLSATRATAQVVVEGWRASTSAVELLEDIARQAGLAKDIRVTADVQYSRGYLLEGPALDAIATLCDDLGCAHEIDGATLRVWPASEPRLETADVWSAETGLLESPSPTGKGDRVRAIARLRPGMRPGDALYLDDPYLEGTVTALEVVHAIDTAGDEWTTAIEGRPR